jgi:hypothetical protein
VRIHFKLTEDLVRKMRGDLLRPHGHAAERVGFISCRFGTSDDGLLILGRDYHPVEDEHYEFDPMVGARFGAAAIRSALQIALSNGVGIFHIHCHEHLGEPKPSRVDWTEWAKFVPNFWHARPELPHGALLLSTNRMSGWCWFPGQNDPMKISRFTVVGQRLRYWEAV